MAQDNPRAYPGCARSGPRGPTYLNGNSDGAPPCRQGASLQTSGTLYQILVMGYLLKVVPSDLGLLDSYHILLLPRLQ
jgi:hypothetical protein